MADGDHSLAIVGIIGIIALVGLLVFLSKGGAQPAGGGTGVLLINPTKDGGYIIVRANSLEAAGFTQATSSG